MPDESKGYTVIDRRGGKNPTPKPACRVCGAAEEHSKDYNKPTMDCIKHLRGKIQTLETELKTIKDSQPQI